MDHINVSALLHNSLGHIFLRYTLIEYKSPKELLTINNYEPLSYAGSYKTLNYQKKHVSLNEITLTLIAFHHPRKLFKELRRRKLAIEKVQNGVYYISKELIPIQLIVTSELNKEQHIWLNSLTDRLTDLTQATMLVKQPLLKILPSLLRSISHG